MIRIWIKRAIEWLIDKNLAWLVEILIIVLVIGGTFLICEILEKLRNGS